VIDVRRNHRRVKRLAVRVACGTALLAAAAGAQGARPGWEDGWHIVRPGDTLESLAQSYLGSEALWRELHALNPGIADPHRIYPGQRIRVYHAPPTREPTAQIEAMSRRVEERPQPVPWRSAATGDLLLERDSLRTHQGASALVRFDDGSTVTLTEESLVFLRGPAKGPRPPSARTRKEIEVLVGQADVAASGDRAGPVDIEVVVGESKSVARAEPAKPVRARSRASGESAQFMAFEGSASVSARGGRVELEPGTGTTVAPRSAPAPAERLLPAPVPVAPAEDEEVERAALQLDWRPVEGAASYLVEACLDSGCGALHERAAGVAAPPWRPRDPSPAILYWRVTPVAASGLDGFASAARKVRLAETVTPEPPELALLAGGEPLAAGACSARPPEVRVRAVGRRSEELAWTLLVDGRDSGRRDLSALAGGVGRHEVAARAVDGRGRAVLSQPAAFVLDGVGPWFELVGVPAPETKGKRKGEAGAASGCTGIALELVAADGVAKLVPCGPAAEPLRVAASGSAAAWTLRDAGGAARLGDRLEVGATSARLAGGDSGCGLAELALRVVPSRYEPGRLMLEAEARDAAGNRSRFDWHVDGL
jgi:hypothetical protein